MGAGELAKAGNTGFMGHARNSGAIIVAVLATITTVVTNLTEIKEGVEKLFGEVTPKLTIVQPRLDFSRFPFSFTIPTSSFPGIKLQPNRPTEDYGEIVIGLSEYREGMIDHHRKVAELGETIQLFIQQLVVDRSRQGYVVIDPHLANATDAGTLRVAIKKETTPAIKNCKMLINDPNNDVVTSFNAVDLPEGIVTDYYEFGVFFFQERPSEGAKWSAVLACNSAGAGPEDLITIP